MSYIEDDRSKKLVLLNRERIILSNSPEYIRFQKNTLLKNAVKELKISFFIQHLKVRLFRNKYYSAEGNKKFEHPEELQSFGEKRMPKIAVYTCIVGAYDGLYEPLYCDSNVDYIVFTDQSVAENSFWKKVDISKWPEYYTLTPVCLNRKVKILPHKYLENYDYTIYIDGNIQLAADPVPLVLKNMKYDLSVHTHANRDSIYQEANGIKLLKKCDIRLLDDQLKMYRKEGFPDHFGLFQNSFLIRNNTSESLKQLMSAWWDEYEKFKTRDQISLPYVIWKSGYDITKINSLGNDIHKNERLYIRPHA